MANSWNQFCGFIKSLNAFIRVPGQGSSDEQLLDILDNDLHSILKKKKKERERTPQIKYVLIRDFFYFLHNDL